MFPAGLLSLLTHLVIVFFEMESTTTTASRIARVSPLLSTSTGAIFIVFKALLATGSFPTTAKVVRVRSGKGGDGTA